MSSSQTTFAAYLRQYADLGFERSGLFAFLQEEYHLVEVLYPGCSFHITPGFYFPHVVFVDRSPSAISFFARRADILDFIMRSRNYKRTPYFQFIAQDFTRPLPVLENQFDLVLALFTGGVSKACKAYLKIGGLLLSNNHQNDAAQAAQDKDLELIAMVRFQRGKYRVVDPEPGESMKVQDQAFQSRRSLRQTTRGIKYVDHECYYLFRRILPGVET